MVEPEAAAAPRLLVATLLDPNRALDLSPREWNGVLRLAREHALAPRLAAHLQARGLLGRIPEKARTHLRAAAIAAESSQTAVRFEINRLARALAGLDLPVILLKGSAYVVAGMPPSLGRFVGDVDLMVPRARIDEVERTLVQAGWEAAELDAYDQRYYREWAHEIPPLQHEHRETPLDVHHTIAPLTARVRPDAAALIEASVELDEAPLRVLGPADMVLHSALHLFNDEVAHPLRDLFDLHDLFDFFGSRPGFWETLAERARLHGLGRPLWYATRCTRRFLGTAVPDRIEVALAPFAPSPPLRRLMDALFAARFVPGPPFHPRRASVALAEWLLYVRAHWLRMPLPLLVRHLSVKATRRLRERLAREPDEDAATV